MEDATGKRLMEMFQLLFDRFGSQHWWPGETDLEIMVGAVLTQNTNWKNVEKAIRNLKQEGLLSLHGLQAVSFEALSEAIRPAGYFRIKARRVKNLIAFVTDRYGGDLGACLEERPETLREGLLSVKGIGPETADSILLYAARRPVFVIDAYTYRILTRHALIGEEAGYEDLQSLFTDHLPEKEKLFNEFHALIVRAGKEYCRRIPLCHECPLRDWGPTPPFQA